MSVSHLTSQRLALPTGLGWAMVAAGMFAVFATYWDEAFHTDVGRDSALSPPHVLLYGSVAIVGLGVAFWGARVLLATRSVRASLAHPPLLSAGVGATTTLVAGGIDIAWHSAYGRDAVLWSPPHMLGVFGTIALTLGVVGGVQASAVALRAAASVLVLANAAAVVFEYEADVPQFSETYYLPVLLGAVLVVAYAIDRLVPHPLAVALVVAGYALTRIAVSAGLTALDRSTPDLPLAILGLAAWNLPLKSRLERAAAAATAMSWLAWFASVSDLASPPPDALLPTTLVVTVVFAVLMARRVSLRTAAAIGTFVVGGLVLWAHPEPAAAHDPGQGTEVAAITLTGTVSGRDITMTASGEEHCNDLQPEGLIARRAGDVVTGPLRQTGAGCTFEGAVAVPTDGKWFTYAEFTHDGATVEAWLPLEAGDSYSTTESRVLYEPAGGADGTPTSQVVFGALLYALGGVVVLVALRSAGWAARTATPALQP